MVWSMMTAPVMASVTSPTEFSAHTLTILGFPEINRKYNHLSITTYINKACNLIFEVTVQTYPFIYYVKNIPVVSGVTSLLAKKLDKVVVMGISFSAAMSSA